MDDREERESSRPPAAFAQRSSEPPVNNNVWWSLAPVDLTLFNRVHEGLADNNTVWWSLAPRSIDYANALYPHPQAVRFLQDYLHQLTGIMLDQHMNKMEPFQQKRAFATLEACARVLSPLLRDARIEFVDTLELLVDPSRILYHGWTGAWTHFPGAPEQRKKVCQMMMANGTFSALASLLEQQAASLKNKKLERVLLLLMERDQRDEGLDEAHQAHVAQAESRPASLDASAEGEEPGDTEAALHAADEATEEASVALALAKKGRSQWLGAVTLSTLVAGLLECGPFDGVGGGGVVAQPGGGDGGSGSGSLEVARRACRAIMMQVWMVSEEELEKENQEAFGHLVRDIRNVIAAPSAAQGGEKNFRQNFVFHAQLVLWHLRSPSLPMRLWGWEQTEHLIDLSRKHRWNAKAYLVEGAGTACCNGIYRVSPELSENVPTSAGSTLGEAPPRYTYRGKGPSDPLMTLFRCNMSTKASWWFISEADPTSPGTDKDVDYYKHKSTNRNNFMPWPTGWDSEVKMKEGATAKGLHPPPTVTPVPSEGYLCPPGEDYDSLEWELARWVVENKVVEEVFGDNINREIVGLSAKLLLFLSSMEDSLTPKHIDLIWSSCLGAEPELQAAVHQLLTTLVECMKPELVVHLIGRLKETTLTSPYGASTAGGRSEVLAFVERLKANQILLTRNKAIKAAIPELVRLLSREPRGTAKAKKKGVKKKGRAAAAAATATVSGDANATVVEACEEATSSTIVTGELVRVVESVPSWATISRIDANIQKTRARLEARRSTLLRQGGEGAVAELASIDVEYKSTYDRAKMVSILYERRCRLLALEEGH